MSSITIRRLTESDLKEADRLAREAFATHIGIEPAAFAPGEDLAAHYWVEPEGAFGAFDGDDLAGIMFANTWGKFGFFGPLCVSPAHWNKGIAQLLLKATDDYFESLDVPTTGLFTFSNSAKHIRLYERAGYFPQLLTADLVKKAEGAKAARGESAGLKLFSKMTDQEKLQATQDMDVLSNEIFPGLSLANEARNSVPSENGHKNFIAETLLVYDDRQLKAFAICPTPTADEGDERRAVYAKFGAAKFDETGENFDRLLDALEEYRALINASKIRASTNTARRSCYQAMLRHGFKVEGHGIAMIRPDVPAYNRADVFVLDDWR